MGLEDIHNIYGKIRVLHIDDDELQLNILKDNLYNINKDIVIESEKNLDKAIEKISQNHYDCILMDLLMPIIDGIQGSKKIRKFSDVPIILYTQKESKNLTENAFNSGISDFLTKEVGINHYKILDEKIKD